MKIHVSCNHRDEVNYTSLRPVLAILKTDKRLKCKEKVDKDGRKHIYFVSIKEA